jgi:hypothetical protein
MVLNMAEVKESETLKAEIQRLNVYVNQLERQVLALTQEKFAVDVHLNAHIEMWQKQTGFKFTGFSGCATLYQKNWEENNNVVLLRK